MKSLVSIALASLASLTVAASSQAATYSGFTIAAGALRGTNLVVQGQTDVNNATSFVTVLRTTGVYEYPAFAVTSPCVCTAVVPDYVITMTVISTTQTRVIWRRLGATMKSRDRVYEVSGTDPVIVAIMGAELELSPTTA